MRKLFFTLMCVSAAAMVAAGAGLADESPASVVRWICPDKPFPEGIGKMRYYRRMFEVREGLVRAEARWWIDDSGCVYVDGGKDMPSSMVVDEPKDLTNDSWRCASDAQERVPTGTRTGGMVASKTS